MLGVVLGIAMVLIVLERTTGWKIFRFVPGMVMMYLLMATLNSLGVFGEEDVTREPIAAVKDVALPAMIFLFLFGCDLRKIIRLGRSEEHTSELQSRGHLVCRLLLEKKKEKQTAPKHRQRLRRTRHT